MSEFPLPDNVKAVISGLPVKDQVVLRSYIAGLRDQLKEYKAKAERAEHGEEDDPHAHYHGHDKCTADHGHDDSHHEEHAAAKSEEGGDACGGGHSHEHKHEHKPEPEPCAHDDGHSHGHGHDHGHKKAEEEEVPAWKKRAMENGGDASEAPFGGDWGAESSMDATK